jgi:hypothetical protein
VSKGFIKLQREGAEELFSNDPDAYLVMTQIMLRARRKNSKYDKYNLQANQALIGDYYGLRLTEKRYRIAKENLEHKYKLISFKGTPQGTIATILNTEFCDLNSEIPLELFVPERANKGRTEGEQNGEQGANKTLSETKVYNEISETRANVGRTEGEQRATNKERKNIRNKETTTTPIPPEPVANPEPGKDSAAAVFYPCLMENEYESILEHLSDEDKITLHQYPENRVKLALDYAKVTEPTKTFMHMIIWHLKKDIPPESNFPKKPRLTDQQKFAFEINDYILSVGRKDIFDQNEKLILEKGYMLHPRAGSHITVSIIIPMEEMRKDFKELMEIYGNKRKVG